jgi:hypothetical protein
MRLLLEAECGGLRPTMDTMSLNRATFRHILFAALALLALAAPVAAADSPSPAPLFGGYWAEFVEHWRGFFQNQNGIVMTALGVGALSLFIITRGKWKK